MGSHSGKSPLPIAIPSRVATRRERLYRRGDSALVQFPAPTNGVDDVPGPPANATCRALSHRMRRRRAPAAAAARFSAAVARFAAAAARPGLARAAAVARGARTSPPPRFARRRPPARGSPEPPPPGRDSPAPLLPLEPPAAARTELDAGRCPSSRPPPPRRITTRSQNAQRRVSVKKVTLWLRMAARKLKNFVKGMTKGSSSSSGRSKAQECLFQGTESLSSNRRQALMEHLPPDMHGQDVNETREEEARGEDAADYDAADADYEQEDDAGGGGGDGWSSGGGQFEGGWSAGGWDSWPSSDAGASSGGGSSRARKSRKTHWVPPPKVPAREEDKILIVLD
eukprot:XP_023157876.1 atherin-like [Zea mays]